MAGITITGNTVVASGDGSGGIVAFTDGTAPVTISGNDVTMRGEGSFGIFVAADFFGIPPGPGPGPGPGPMLTLVASEIGSPGMTRITGNTVTLGGANSVGIVGMGGLGFPDTVVGANAVPLTGGVIRDNTVLTSLESQTGFGLTSGGMTGDNNTESGPGTACIDLVGGNDVFVNGRRCRVQPPR